MNVSYCLFSITMYQLIVKDTSHDFHLQSNKRHKKLDVTSFFFSPKDAFKKRGLEHLKKTVCSGYVIQSSIKFLFCN